MMKLLRHEWDRVLVYLLLMAFGAYATIYPIVSFERAAPYWAEILLGAEFFIAAVFLMIGMGKRKGYRMAGLSVVVVGLVTISLIIGIVGGTRVLSYAFLFGAFAMQQVSEIRRENRNRKLQQAEEKELTYELIQLADGLRTGDDK